MSLTGLPPELFDHVVDNIDSQPALCSLAQCSRQFHHYLIPCLYRHVTIHERSRRYILQGTQLEKFALLIIRRPDLARLVRSLTVHVTPVDDDDDDDLFFMGSKIRDESDKVSPEIVRVDPAFETAINALKLSEEEEKSWLQNLGDKNRKRHPDLMIALLLPALLKVEKLILDLNDEFGTFGLEETIQRAIRRERPFDIQPLFEALTVIDTHNWYIVQTREFVASLLRLPAIQVISSTVGGGSEVNKSLKELDSSSSTLTTLNLTVRSLNSADLRHILRAPKALKNFSYLDIFVKFTDIRHALEPQKHCLETLGFDCTDDEYPFVNDNWRGALTGPMTSFVNFNMVKVFKTTVCFLDRTEAGSGRDSLINIFPPNLETLHLTRFQAYAGSLVEALEHLLAQESPQQMPVLKKLILEEGRPDEDDEHPNMTDVLWKDTQETVIEMLSRVGKARGVFIDAIPNV